MEPTSAVKKWGLPIDLDAVVFYSSLLVSFVSVCLRLQLDFQDLSPFVLGVPAGRVRAKTGSCWNDVLNLSDVVTGMSEIADGSVRALDASAGMLRQILLTASQP